jgi:hypothetical protein
MELDHQELELVRDAVFNRDMKTVGSFLFNKAAEKLQSIGISTLPEIEHVLLREVTPCCDNNLDYVPKPFLGVPSLLVSYFQLCGESQLQDAVRFLRSLQGTLRIEAMRAINLVWLAQKPPVAIPEALMDVVREVSSRGSAAEKQVAEWLIQRQREKDEEPKDFRDELLQHLRSEGES